MTLSEPSQANVSENLEIQEKLKNKDIALLNCGLGAKESTGAYGRILLGVKTGVIRRYLALKWVNKEGAKQIELEALAEYIKYHKAQTNLITVHDVWGGGPEDGYLCYSMDLADDAKLGRAVENDKEIACYKPDNLYTRMHDGDSKRVLPLKEINQYVMGLLDGLEHLEKLGLVHRDIKPENVLFLSGNAVMGDLGCMVKQDTEVWCGAGTWSYMSAEQRNKGMTGKCYCYEDLYQLGEVIYRLCLNLQVKEHLNYCYVAASRDGMAPPMRPPLMEVPGVLTAYEAKLLNAFVTLHACAAKPSDRFHSVVEFREAWKELMENARDPERQTRLLRQKKLRRFFQIANVVFVMLILILAGVIVQIKRAVPPRENLASRSDGELVASFPGYGSERPLVREFIHDEWYDPWGGRLDEEWEVSSPDRLPKLPEKKSAAGGMRRLDLFWEGRELPDECEIKFTLIMFREATECILAIKLEPVDPPANWQPQNAEFKWVVTHMGIFEEEFFSAEDAMQDAEEKALSRTRHAIELAVQKNQRGGQVVRLIHFESQYGSRDLEVPDCGPLRLRVQLVSESDGKIELSQLRLFKPSEAPVSEDEWLVSAQDEMPLWGSVPDESAPVNGQ